MNKLCISLIGNYSNGKIGENAIQHILEAFWKSDVYESATPVQVQMAISAYIMMLDQAESAQESVTLPGGEVWQDWNDKAQEERWGSPDSVRPQPEDTGAVVEYRTNRSWEIPDPEMSLGRRGANESVFAWARDEDSEINSLTLSQELTDKLIWNQTFNIKVTKHNLFSARGLLEFLDTKIGWSTAGECGWPWCHHLWYPLNCDWQLSGRDSQRLQIPFWTFETNQNCQEPQGLAYWV